jgi:hypothetical protein
MHNLPKKFSRFKPLYWRLRQPVANLRAAVMQIDDRQDASIHARIFHQR